MGDGRAGRAYVVALVLFGAGCSAPEATRSPSPSAARPDEAAVSPLRLHAQTLLPHAAPEDGRQLVTASIARVSLAGDAEPELLVAEPARGQLTWLRGCGSGACQATPLGGLGQPVRSATVDADGDGDTDVLVADIGSVPAIPDPVGRVLLLVNQGDQTFQRRMLLGGVGRVSCAEPADLDADGDVDVVVCEFGAQDGAVSWLERREDGRYVRHEIVRGAGAIEALPTDLDHDGDTDVVVSLSQDFQQIVLLRNDGGGRFARETLWQAPDDFGLVGLTGVDLDLDGDLDFVVSGGDYFDEDFTFDTQGVVWLDNRGGGVFVPRRLAYLVGAHVTRAADLDGDCDLDLAVATLRVERLLPEAQRDAPDLYWLENDGTQRFRVHGVDAGPAHTASLALVDYGAGPAWFVGSFTSGTLGARDVRLGALWPDARGSEDLRAPWDIGSGHETRCRTLGAP